MPSNFDDTSEDTFFGGTVTDRRLSLDDAAKLKLQTIHDAKSYREKGDWDKKFSNYIKIYSNQYPYTELEDYEDIVVPNMIFSTVNIIVPSVAVRAPKITVTPKRPQEAAASEVVEAVVNHQWAERDVQEQVRQAVKDMVIVGHGWLAVEWENVVEERDLTGPELQQAAMVALQQREQALSAGADVNDFPTTEETIQGLDRTTEEVVVDAPKVSRVSPFDVFVDPDAMRLPDARWVAVRRFVPIEAARKNEDWPRAKREKLKPSVVSEARKDVQVMDSEQRRDSKDDGFVIVYDFYNLLDGTVCVLGEGVTGYLEKPSKSPFPGTHPLVYIPNYEVPERFFPIGDVEMIYGLQLELAITRTQMINDRKRGRRITMYRSGELGADAVDALEGGEDNVMIDVVSDRPFADLFQQVASQGLHPEWYGQADMILNDINMVAGVSEYDRGQIPEITRTATEAGLIQDASNSRSADKLARVERAMSEVAERMIKLAQRFMDIEDVAKVVSDDQVVAWVPYSRMDLQGDFVFAIEAGSSQPMNETFRRQSALQMMDAFGPLLGSGYIERSEVH